MLSINFTAVGTMGPGYAAQPCSCGWHGPCKWKALPFSLLGRGDALNPTRGKLRWLWKARKSFLFLGQALSQGDTTVTLPCLCTRYLLSVCEHENVRDLSRLAGGPCVVPWGSSMEWRLCQSIREVNLMPLYPTFEDGFSLF